MIMEPKADRQKRSLKLIAEFVNGYATEWHFAVRECFKNELDIKYTQRIEDSKKVMRWTQGSFYCFAEGHVLYDTPKGYLQWSEALKHIEVVCSVVSATPNTLNEQGAFVNGQVHFKLSKPNQSRTVLETVDNYHATQNEFVKFLKDGTLKGKTVHQLLAIPKHEDHTQQLNSQ